MQDQKPLPELMTMKEVAAAFGVAVGTVERWERSGQFDVAIRTPGGGKRYRRTDIDALLRGPR